MRVSVFALIFFFVFLLVSCSQNKLPVIKDPEALRKECVTLFQLFPTIEETNLINLSESRVPFETVNAISKNNWPPSIQNLKPFIVKRDNYGIYIWIKSNKNPTETVSGNWVAKGYFIPCRGFAPFNIIRSKNPFFTATDLPGIYEVDIPALAL